MKYKIYLDDVRTPVKDGWTVVRSYDEFMEKVVEIGLNNIEIISFDHDLGDTAMEEYYNNVSPNFTLNYDNIKEKTGLDCVKWLVNFFYETETFWCEKCRSDKKRGEIPFPLVYVHSANPIGSPNIMGYINNFLMNEGQPRLVLELTSNTLFN